MSPVHYPLLLPILCYLLLTSSSLSDDEHHRCHPDDRAALLDFKTSFSDPNSFPSWNPNTDCCTWNSIDCNENTKQVQGLTITYHQTFNKIPDPIARLTHLRTLILRKLPNLVGEIPPSIARLKNLVYLDISWTNLSGPIPQFLGQLQNLQFLTLSYNNLSGSIPGSLSNLPKILELSLDRNRLTGTIPESFGRLPKTSPDLVLSHNKLSGEIPESLGKVDFRRIDLSRNDLTGDASMLFNASKTTQFLDISRNAFEFDFSLVSFPPKTLVALDISHNKIWGSIPSQITESVLLQALNVSYNRLCGEIPQDWHLKYRSEIFDNSSYIHNRCLCGLPLQSCK